MVVPGTDPPCHLHPIFPLPFRMLIYRHLISITQTSSNNIKLANYMNLSTCSISPTCTLLIVSQKSKCQIHTAASASIHQLLLFFIQLQFRQIIDHTYLVAQKKSWNQNDKRRDRHVKHFRDFSLSPIPIENFHQK